MEGPYDSVDEEYANIGEDYTELNSNYINLRKPDDQYEEPVDTPKKPPPSPPLPLSRVSVNSNRMESVNYGSGNSSQTRFKMFIILSVVLNVLLLVAVVVTVVILLGKQCVSSSSDMTGVQVPEKCQTETVVVLIGGVPDDYNQIHAIGDDGFAFRSVNTFLISEDDLIPERSLLPLPEPRFKGAAAVYNNILFLIGGAKSVVSLIDTDSHSSVWAYNLVDHSWEVKADMQEEKTNHVALVVSKRIYIAGGYNVPNSILDTVKSYSVEDNSWRSEAKLPFPLDLGSACVIGDTGYIVGGRKTNSVVSRDILVMMYDKSADTIKWFQRADVLPKGRWAMSVATDGENIYIMGGSDGSLLDNDLYLYNPTSTSLTTLTAMPRHREFSQAVYLKGFIYIHGGWGTSLRSQSIVAATDTVLRYDVNNDVWSELNITLPCPVIMHSVALIDMCSNQ